MREWLGGHKVGIKINDSLQGLGGWHQGEWFSFDPRQKSRFQVAGLALILQGIVIDSSGAASFEVGGPNECGAAFLKHKDW
jgi:hypothetical protein